MAGYTFETITASQAAAFGSGDYLTFTTSTASSNQVTVAPYANGNLSSGIDVSFGGKTITFPNTISTASQADHIIFPDGTHLQIGSDNATDSFTPLTATGTTAGSQANTVYGLGGDDTINFTTTVARTSNYLNGGFGADTIMGGAGNNHIYGNSSTSQSGATDGGGSIDGGDTITVTTGSNYINGNGGADIITVGVTGTAFTPATTTGTTTTAAMNGTASTGANRVFGGGQNDTITVHGQGANAVNGNTGNDIINASDSTGNNSLRGGADSDVIYGGHGQTVFMGDNGADTLVAGAGGKTTLNDGSTTSKLSIMTGGAGSDTFDFSGAAHGSQAAYTDAGYAGTMQGQNGTYSGIVIGGATYYQTITDFTQGSDQIHLGFTVDGTNGIVTAQSGVTFSSVAAAQTYAQGLLDNNEANNTFTGTGDVAAINVNGNTYLFYDHAGSGQIDSIIQLTGVNASTLTQGGSGTTTFG